MKKLCLFSHFHSKFTNVLQIFIERFFNVCSVFFCLLNLPETLFQIVLHVNAPHTLCQLFDAIHNTCFSFCLHTQRVRRLYTGWAKNVPLYFCPYLCQLLTDFQNFFTDTLRRQFAIT